MDSDLQEILERIEGRVERTEHQLIQIDERLPVALEPVTTGEDRLVELQEHYGAAVWTDVDADAQRRASSLCYHCRLYLPNTDQNCGIAEYLYKGCCGADVAVTVTRCKHFRIRAATNPTNEVKSTVLDLEDEGALESWADEGGGNG